MVPEPKDGREGEGGSTHLPMGRTPRMGTLLSLQVQEEILQGEKKD